MPPHHIHTTTNGVEIFVEQGKKSAHDFLVKFMGPHGRPRTPRHIHLIVELYVKYAHNPALTLLLRDHLIHLLHEVQPIVAYPPALQVYNPNQIAQFADLNAVGEFSAEFVLVAAELLFIQEKTNYPEGKLTQQMYTGFGVKDRYSIIGLAVRTVYGGG
jgi:hypothetical protein